MDYHIDPLADHLDLVPTIARWHWDEWGDADPGGSLDSWTAGLRERTHRHRIPTTLVALAEDTPIGSVTLVEHDMDTHRDLAPWLAGLFVLPPYRRKGVGSTLVRTAVDLAASFGASRLYLYTRTAESLYRKLGWTDVSQEEYEGHTVTIMSIELSPGDTLI